MFDDPEDEQHLAEVTERLRVGRQRLAMTVYSIRHRRRTPVQVEAVLDRASRAIRRSELVRARRKHERAVH
jgi:hypothetical protein